MKAPVLFTNPYSFWQKGTIENSNKLIRQYLPKTMDIKLLSYNKILVIQNKLNIDPEKCFFKILLPFFFITLLIKSIICTFFYSYLNI